MNESNIEKRLFDLQDKEYKEFQSKLIPNINKDNIIGIRIPHLRKLAKEIAKENQRGDFLNSLPHKYYEENHLHSFLIEEMKDEKECLESLDKFLPYVDNWAVCDSCSPKVLKKDLDLLLDYIKKWINSPKEYVCRFGILSFMRYFLEDKTFKEEYLEMVCEVKSNYYYVKMMQSWFFATALAKQYNSTLKIFKQNRLPVWVHNKSIQKAIESYRITEEQKQELKLLKQVN
ncbi:MAG: DNA alkylation repair protein [Bacteroidales bacterium]|nr:DNA alkylation repair protein [Bacteroidales bacterium]